MRHVPWIALAAGGCVPHLYGEEQLGPGMACDALPANSWEGHQALPPEDLEGEGFGLGDVARDFCLRDQHGDEIGLWPFFGNVILLDISTIWCAPCQELAKDTERTWSHFVDDGFVYLTVLQEDNLGAPIANEGLRQWADAFGISAPIVEDAEKVLEDAVLAISGQLTYPGVLLIDRKMKVREHLLPESDIDGAIAQAL